MYGLTQCVVLTITLFSCNALISVGHQRNENDTVVKSIPSDIDPLPATLLEEVSPVDAVAVEAPPVDDEAVSSPETVIPPVTEAVTTNTTADAVSTNITDVDGNNTVSAPHAESYDKLYQRGVHYYLENDWNHCASYFQLAINDYHWYHEKLLGCRRGCKIEAEAATLLTTPLDNTQIFFESTIRNALCLLKCRRNEFSARHNHVAPSSMDRDFEIMKPYDYLQLCLFKVGRFQEAASAAVTVLAAQPEHTIMAQNLKQYIDDYAADPEALENLEIKDYGREYIQGDRFHTEEDYENSVLHMEKALELYWPALDDCRVMCEEPFDQGWFPDFVSSVANHFTFTFRCKRGCTNKLGNLYGQEIPNFLPSIFNYLQFAYHKLNKVPIACAAVENYLELVPADASMLRNKQYYQSEFQKIERYFTPSKAVVEHAARERYESRLMHFIDTEFVFLEDDKIEQLPQAAPAPSIRETLSDMLTSVFTGQPSSTKDTEL